MIKIIKKSFIMCNYIGVIAVLLVQYVVNHHHQHHH